MSLHVRHHPTDEHLRHLPLTPLSKLAPFSGLMLTVVLVILILIKQYLLEPFFPRLYHYTYTRLNDTQRRGFLNHHIAGGTKLLILIIAVYPFISVAFRYGTPDTPMAKGGSVTMGDVLVTALQMLVGMYIFELIYRNQISPISTLHHLGAILVAESAVAINLHSVREPDAVIEFVLCTVWGAFDIVCEMCPHVAIILYRLYPEHHRSLKNLFLFAAITTFVGTVTETIVVIYLFGSLWSRWELAFKIVTPILHIAFSATQLHGTRIFVAMWIKERRLYKVGERMGGPARIEEGDITSTEVSEVSVVGMPKAIITSKTVQPDEAAC